MNYGSSKGLVESRKGSAVTMGTNYYVVPSRASIREPVHIGKSSWGWLFCFQDQDNPWWGDPPVVWHTYEQVMAWLLEWTVEKTDYVIMNEYDEIVSYEEFKKLVDEKQSDPGSIANKGNFAYGEKNVNGYRFIEGDFW